MRGVLDKVWVIISEGDKELKVMEKYTGPLPQIGERLTFLSGEGIFEITKIGWLTSSDEWYTFSCHIQVEKTEDLT